MTRLLASLVLVAWLGPLGPRPQAGTERTSAKVVIDAVAVDRKGAPVMDLKPAEIEVWIGHFRVPIESLSVVTPETDERAGRLIVLLLDDLTLPPALVPRAREAARRFVTKMMPGDQMAIVTLSGTTTKNTDDPAQLARALDAYNVRATGFSRLDLFNEELLKTVATLSRQMTEAPGRRKTIVGIGSASMLDRPLLPPQFGRDLTPEWVDAMRAMAFAHVNFYVIDPTGVGASRVDTGEDGFARASGGRAFLSTNDLNKAVDQILRDASNFYVMAVPDPPVGSKADLRELRVRSLRRGVTMIARRAIPGSL